MDVPLSDPIMPANPSAILFAPAGASAGGLRGLVERLINASVAVTVVEQLDAIVPLYECSPEQPPCVLIDCCALENELEDGKRATETIKKVLALVPRAQPIIVTDGANASLILACIRAGAADVIDLVLEGTGVARAVVQRVWHKQTERVVEITNIRALRSMVEELVKDLVRTERRSIDLEDRAPGGDMRPPAILLIESDRAIADELADRLEAAGIAAYAYVSGEQALHEAKLLAKKTGLDLALVAAQLPGIDGLETIRRLRDLLPGLDAFLVTSIENAHLAADAADLGVVGFVHKPLADIGEVVGRLAQLAREALQRAREATYVQRIKTRHERVLARYRSLPREP
jgi:DNA-binding NarL/FixJ family response regulator